MSFVDSPVLIDGVSFIAASTGTGDYVFSVARPSFWTPAQAVTAGTLTDGQRVNYLAQDDPYAPTQREWGLGTYVNSTLTVQRTSVKGGISGGISSGTSKVNFTKAPVVSLTALAENLVQLDANHNVTLGNTVTSNQVLDTLSSYLQVATNDTSAWGFTHILATSIATDGAGIAFAKTRGTDPTAQSAVANNDLLGQTWYYGSDGTAFRESAFIDVNVDATPATSSVPARITFATTPAGTSQAPIERMRIDSNGNITIAGGLSGTQAQALLAGFVPIVQIHGFGSASSGFAQCRWNADTSGVQLLAFKSRSSSINGQTILQSGDAIQNIESYGSDGAAMQPAAAIQMVVDGTPAANNMPGRIAFLTNGGSTTVTERMRIDSLGQTRFFTTPGATNSTMSSADQTGVTVTNGSNAAIAPYFGQLIIIRENNSGNLALYLMSQNGTSQLVSDASGGVWVAPTTAPAAGKMSVANNGTQFNVYNNRGSTSTFQIMTIRVG